MLNLLSPNRRPIRPPSLSPEFQNKDTHLTYGPPSLRYESESSSESSLSTPTTPTEAHATLQNLLYRGVEPRVEEIPDTIVYIDLLSDHLPSSPISGGEEATSWTSTNEAIAEERSWTERGYKIERASHLPRHLRDIDPTITLLSRAETSAQSHFSVHTDDGIVFSETTALEPLDPTSAPTADGSLLYKTSLVPGFWDTISQSPGKLNHRYASPTVADKTLLDASQYVVIQRVMPDASSSTAPSTIFSAMYKFNYVSPVSSSHAHTLDQTYSSHNMSMLAMDAPHVVNHKPDYGFDNLLSIDPENFEIMNFNKPQNGMFDLGPYMRQDDWSPQCSPTESVFSVDCSQPPTYSINGVVDEHQLLPTSSSSFPLSDVPNYVSSDQLLVPIHCSDTSLHRQPL